jgi:hypothetical protein
VLVLLLCWAVWSLFSVMSGGSPLEPVIGFALAAGATLAAFWVSRLIGRLMLGRRQRAGALPSHLVAATFAVLCGLAFLSVTPFSWGPVESLARGLLPF